MEKFKEEKFIEKNIAELAMSYDTLRGANVNIARITPDLIDGLKPVQRRALYIMFLKDGGRGFRKVGTIAGDTFGRVHPHCLEKNTEFITEEGIIKIGDMDQNKIYNSYSFDYNNKVYVKSKIFNVRITKYVDEFCVIHLSNGKYIKCTTDHQFLIINNNDIVWKDAISMKEGDLVLSSIYFLYDEPLFLNIYIKSINIEKLDHEEPVYDFTVEKYQNALISIDTYNGKSFATMVAHNSPTSIEDCIVNITQEWHNILPLIEGSGNFGDCSGSPAGAGRYIKARLSEYCIACFFEDWKDSVVDMSLAYDEETMMPDYLPAKYPNILLNGTLGIG